MPLQIAIGVERKEGPQGPGLVINLQGKIIQIKLDARKSLDGNIMIFDHKFFDIILIPFKNKILTIPKSNKNIDVYEMQDHFFNFLRQRGAIIDGSIRGGNVFGSLEAFYPVNEEIDVLQVLLLLSREYLDEYSNTFDKLFNYMDDVEEMYLDPDKKDSTEYGEVPQAPEKGTLPAPYDKPYGLLYRI